MNILITAGGTTEPIDAVRSITNTSTGKLGSLIADAFCSFPDVNNIYYICSQKAILPQTDKAEIIPVDSVASLETAVRKVLSTVSIDIVVHSMAVSDYRVKRVTSSSRLADTLQSELYLQKDTKTDDVRTDDVQLPNVTQSNVAQSNVALPNVAQPNVAHPNVTGSLVASWIANSQSVINGNGKINSNIEHMVLLMEQTPKIISLYKDLCPDAVLVGFKLLDHVEHDFLIDTAYHILQENKCSLVLANDLRDITESNHTSYLIDKDKSYHKYVTKQKIAEAIASATVRKRRNLS